MTCLSILEKNWESESQLAGFNKIRWLIRQPFGFRDREYFKLQIFQLPEISCVKEVWVWAVPVEEAKNLLAVGENRIQNNTFAEVISNLPVEKLPHLATLLDAYLPLSQKEELLLKLT